MDADDPFMTQPGTTGYRNSRSKQLILAGRNIMIVPQGGVKQYNGYIFKFINHVWLMDFIN